MISLFLLLSACGGQNSGGRAEELALEIRTEYTAMQSCQGSVEMTADYGTRVYDYGIDFTSQTGGETVLTVTAPENIAGVIARIQKDSTLLDYDGARVDTGPLASDGMSPVDALPALLRCVREGFIAECVLEGEGGEQTLHVISREPEASPGSGREIALWFDAATHGLLRAELMQDGFTVLQCRFTAFSGA